MDYLLGIDIGTTGTKTILVAADGEVISSAYEGYPLYSQKDKSAEQDARDWWNAVIVTVRKCMAEKKTQGKVKAVSLSTQGGTLVPVDGQGNPLRKSITWMDARAVNEGRELQEKKPENYYYYCSGWPMGCNCGSSILWLRKNENKLYEKTAYFLTTLDFINYCLCGKYVTDYTNAAMTGMVNVKNREWDSYVYNELGLERKNLPQLVSAGTIIGNLTNDAAEALGLDRDVLVVNGAHDQYCAGVGAGAIHNGDVMLATGTAWVVLGVWDRLIYDTRNYFSPGVHASPGMYGLMATLTTGGVAMEWFRNNFCSLNSDGGKVEESFKRIDTLASQTAAGAEGVFFYPYFHGSPVPNRCPDVKASFLGIDLHHDRYALARAVMEGVAFTIKWILEALEETGGPLGRIYMTGGAAKSSFWTQVTADIIGKPITTMKTADAPCIGAAIMAGVGAGIYKNFEQGCSCLVKADAWIEPIQKNKNVYGSIYEKYKAGYHYLEEFYGAINK